MNPQPDYVTRVVSEHVDATRVIVFQRVQGDTYVIIDDGEVSLSNGETLKLLLQHIHGR